MSEDNKQQDTYIGVELKKYNVTDASIAELSERCLALKVSGIDDKEGYEVVKTARIGVKNRRVEVEKKRKELKADSVAFGKAVDGEAKRIFALIAPIEDHLIAQEKIVEDEKDRVKEEKAEKERKEGEERQKEFEEANRVEEERLEKVRLEQEATAAELKKQQDKIDADNKRIADEEVEKERLANVQKVEEEAAELARINANKEQEEKEEQERKDVEQAQKDEALRVAMLPDKEKLLLYAERLRAIELPSLSHQESHAVLTEAVEMVKGAYKLLKGGD